MEVNLGKAPPNQDTRVHRPGIPVLDRTGLTGFFHRYGRDSALWYVAYTGSLKEEGQ